jgi:hypothetical protein
MYLHRRQFLKLMAAASSVSTMASGMGYRSRQSPALRKLKDFAIYQDPFFYCMAPSVVCRRDGEIILAFRRAPERRAFGERSTGHTDPNAQLVSVVSRDGGDTWSKDPKLIFAHPFGGVQDPCLAELDDTSIVCASYAWLRLNPDSLIAPPPPVTTRAGGEYGFLGGFVLRSEDAGKTWNGPFNPSLMPNPDAIDAFGNRVPMFNRGAMCQGRNGRLYWAARSLSGTLASRHYQLHLLISDDRGETWQHSCQIAAEPDVSFTETSLIETPAGDLVAFVRARRLNRRTSGTGNGNGTLQGVSLEDHISVVVRSTDEGRSFRPWQDAGFFGFPHHALRLPDGRVWLTYGYRKPPFGIRARVLNPECTDLAESPEIVLRDDGGSSDLGYPWSALLPDGRILTVYYFNLNDGLRHIAGTVVG